MDGREVLELLSTRTSTKCALQVPSRDADRPLKSMVLIINIKHRNLVDLNVYESME